MRTEAIHNEKSLGELFGELANETSTLVKQEVQLAATELAQKAKYAGTQAVYVAIGAYIGLMALVSLLAAAVIGLGVVIPLWAAAVVGADPI